MSSSDEDYLPDPDSPRGSKKPPDRAKAKATGGKKRKYDDAANQQSGLNLHDDFNKGRCSFFYLSEVFDE